jgi:integrase
MSGPTSDLIDSLCVGRKSGDKIFRWDRAPTHLWCRFGDVVKKAGLDNGRRSKFHQLRRCAATHYAAAGGNATLLLDHSSPKITKAYGDIRMIDQGIPACDVLPKISD